MKRIDHRCKLCGVHIEDTIELDPIKVLPFDQCTIKELLNEIREVNHDDLCDQCRMRVMLEVNNDEYDYGHNVSHGVLEGQEPSS